MAAESEAGRNKDSEPGAQDTGSGDPALEDFGPTTSLEPDAPVRTGPDPQHDLVIPLGADDPAARGPGGTAGKPKEEPAAEHGGRGVPADAGRRRLAHLLDRIRGTHDAPEPAEASATEAAAAAASPSGDWSHGTPAGGEAAPPPHAAYATDTAHAAHADSDAAALEDAESVFLLDDAFLLKTFKEVRFPASRELVLRYVDMEQDFAYGQDRTVNLHTLITHLEQDRFRTRKELLDAIHGRLLLHH